MPEIVPTEGRNASPLYGSLKRCSVAVFDRLSTVGEDMLGIAGSGLAVQPLAVPQMIGLLHGLGVAKLLEHVNRLTPPNIPLTELTQQIRTYT